MKKCVSERAFGAILAASVLAGCDNAETSGGQQVDNNSVVVGQDVLRGEELLADTAEGLNDPYRCLTTAGGLALREALGAVDEKNPGVYQQSTGEGWVDTQRTEIGYAYNFEVHPSDMLVVRGNASALQNDLNAGLSSAWEESARTGDVTLDEGFAIWNLATGEGGTLAGDPGEVCAVAYDIQQAVGE